MDYKDYYDARSKVVEIMGKDFLGPLSDNEIICDERPLDYYIVGKLYPQESNADELAKLPTDYDIGELDETDGEDTISLCNNYNPSSFGISFSVNPGIETFTISAKAASYSLIDRETAQKALLFSDDKYTKKNTKFWQRNQLNIPNININIKDLTKGKAEQKTIGNNLSISILFHKEYPDGSKTITVSVVNHHKIDLYSRDSYVEECANSFFQPEIKIIANTKESFGDVRRNIHLSDDSEIKELNMLYSRVRDYASGHGCAVDWEPDADNDAVVLKTTFLPTYDLKQMMSTDRYKDSSFLGMKYLATCNVEEVTNNLKKLIFDYSQWISEQRKTAIDFDDDLHETVMHNLDLCEETSALLLKSIELLKDKTVFKAFSYANRAMFEQRKKGLENREEYTDDKSITWFPFQLAFFLKEIYSIVYPESDERKRVDLLWFPTGGGKTEAYLGIAAFTIFYRRLKYGNDGNGVTVLMRYTLRLLSFQQFERASALICACELIRKKENIPGGEIGIGLWAGQALTPNEISKAGKILNGELEANEENGNPVQLTKCPWCGTDMAKENYRCDTIKKRMFVKCGNPGCDFKEGLPVYLIDEEIYKYTPSFIIGTIDKFAQLALNDKTFALFGLDSDKKPPELIIQDELHLISGPLGTITGLYEAAIRKLCEHKGRFPKVIASTATIRNAGEQIKHLYSSDFTQFPPQGTDINDSFFAVISDKTQRPARMYLGCMAIGTSPTTMMIRVMASLLFATRYLATLGYDEKVIDSFWTLTAYFNTLRELGGAIIRVLDDIQDRFDYLRKTKFSSLYPITEKLSRRYDNYKELTSREKSENIGKVIQNELKIPYKADGTGATPYDFLLCSNMISVGIDIGRLGTMIVVGQPKTSSEYIQSTSRVGRETPGLVIATYNQAKSRDRSHYEKFTQYHGSFYKFVEATSITPFSVRARDRALQALYVILCRYKIQQLRTDSDAVNFNRSIPELKEIRDYIAEYVKKVDPDEYIDIANDLDEIEAEWERKAARRSDKLKYRCTKYSKPDDALFDPDYNENSRFRVLNSMRSVETTVNVIVKE